MTKYNGEIGASSWFHYKEIREFGTSQYVYVLEGDHVSSNSYMHHTLLQNLQEPEKVLRSIQKIYVLRDASRACK
jgi:hypothetical protein